MKKTILVTGATDGIGLLTAQKLSSDGHTVLLHGRSPAKLEAASAQVAGVNEVFVADLSDLTAVRQLANDIMAKHDQLDVIINNAGVLKAPVTRTADGLDIRFVVNTLAPYVLTRALLPITPKSGRIVNLSSAAQAPVDPGAMAGQKQLADMDAYAQSKLAITIWTREMAAALPDGPMVVAVNPGSLLASKMVNEGFGIAGNDLSIGADILCDAALGERFAQKSGAYFDNDAGRFAEPNSAALDETHRKSVMQAIEDLVSRL